MRLFLVRRTRSFIQQNYAKSDEMGRAYLPFADGRRSYFPTRVPATVKFAIDENGDQYSALYADDVVTTISNLHLPRYGLGKYVAPKMERSATPSEREQLARAFSGWGTLDRLLSHQPLQAPGEQRCSLFYPIN